MREIHGVNKSVICEPFRSRAVEVKSVGAGEKGFKHIASKNLLVPLTAVYEYYGSDLVVRAGDLAYVRHEGVSASWAKEIDIDLGNGEQKTVIVVPADQIVMVERVPPVGPSQVFPDAESVPLPPVPAGCGGGVVPIVYK